MAWVAYSMVRALVCGCWGCYTAPATGDCFYRKMKGPNQALQLTADRRVTTPDFYERVLDDYNAQFRQRQLSSFSLDDYAIVPHWLSCGDPSRYRPRSAQ